VDVGPSELDRRLASAERGRPEGLRVVLRHHAEHRDALRRDLEAVDAACDLRRRAEPPRHGVALQGQAEERRTGIVGVRLPVGERAAVGADGETVHASATNARERCDARVGHDEETIRRHAVGLAALEVDDPSSVRGHERVHHRARGTALGRRAQLAHLRRERAREQQTDGECGHESIDTRNDAHGNETSGWRRWRVTQHTPRHRERKRGALFRS
jgi:hypothetical protein